MRGVGGPLLTIGDLLSDLAVEGGDGPLVGVGDASAPSSPAASQQAEKADPSDLSRLFEVRARFPSTHVLSIGVPSIDSFIVGYSYTSGIVELTTQFGNLELSIVSVFFSRYITHSAVAIWCHGGRAAAAARAGVLGAAGNLACSVECTRMIHLYTTTVLLSADTKKPGGAAKEIKTYFGCSASNLVMVGV